MIASNLKAIYEQKRKGFYDMAGSVVLLTDTGNICVVNNSEEESFASTQIITKEKAFNVYEEQGKMVVVDKNDGLKVKNIEYVHVSQYTNKVIEDILSPSTQKLLPNIEQGYLAHKMLFEYMELQGVKDLNVT
jgi:hypothetical protein